MRLKGHSNIVDNEKPLVAESTAVYFYAHQTLPLYIIEGRL